MSNYSPTRDTLAKRIAGEIVLSGAPGQTMRKWRGLLSVNQIDMAHALELSPSVISDYETGRRKSPGAGFIKRYVDSLLGIDEVRGGHYIKQLSRITLDPSDVFGGAGCFRLHGGGQHEGHHDAERPGFLQDIRDHQ